MGTHPIFESDFDCLTEIKWVRENASPGRPDRATVGTRMSSTT